MNRLLSTWLTAGSCTLAAGAATIPTQTFAQSIGDKIKSIGDAGKKAADDAAQKAKDAVTAAAKKTMPPTDLNAPLPTDERLVTGTLPNGLSYIVVKNGNPPGRANMWIHISSGSLNEKDSQRGIAHYLEHMAFNGSQNFAPGSVVDFFQSMGLTFGRDQNAFTSFDQTTYQLAFPDTKPETLEKGMRFFSDIAGKLSLLPEEIDKERQIILEEKRTRAGGRQRMQDYILERIAPGSLFGKRVPIGIDETLLKMTRPDFTDYYDHWYVPSNMTVIVVADAEPSAIIGQITKAFGDGEKKPKPVDQETGVKPYDSTRAIVASDPEQNTAEIGITRINKPTPAATTVGAARADLVRQLATRAFNHRIGKKLDKGGTSYLRASASASNAFNSFQECSIDSSGKPENWKQMLDEVAADVQRARLHGFTAREIDDIKTDMVSGAEQAVSREPSITSPRLIQRINNQIAAAEPVMSPKQELDLLKSILPTITPEEVSKVFTELFDPTYVTFIAQLPTSVSGGVPTEEQLIALGRKALDVKPEAEKEGARAAALMTSKPKPGAVVSESEHKATSFSTALLDNGIVVHHRYMDYNKSDATLTITLAAGSIQENAANRGVSEVAGLAFAHPATSTLSSSDITDLMNGKKARLGGGGGGPGGRGGRGGPSGGRDTMSLTVSGDPTDFEPAMQLAYLMLTDPKIEEAAFDKWKTFQKQFIEIRSKTIEGVFGTALAETIYPKSDVRTQLMSQEQVDKVTVEAAQKWLKNAIATAPIEVSVVGDISREQAMDLVKTYLGSLPKRDKIGFTTLASLRKLDRPKGPIMVERTLDTQTDKAQVLCGFYACDASNVIDRRNLTIASQVISTRMLKLVREEEQLAYSPRAGLSPAVEYPGFGLFILQTDTKPTKVGRLIEVTQQIFAEFSKSGPTSEEMETVKKQIANTLDSQMKEPSYWLTLSREMAYRDSKLDDALAAPEYYQSLTPDAVRASFNKYYSPAASFTVVARPEKASAGGEKSSSAEHPEK